MGLVIVDCELAVKLLLYLAKAVLKSSLVTGFSDKSSQSDCLSIVLRRNKFACEIDAHGLNTACEVEFFMKIIYSFEIELPTRSVGRLNFAVL